MNPSKEAIEAMNKSYGELYKSTGFSTDTLRAISLDAVYAIDVAPLEQHIELAEEKINRLIKMLRYIAFTLARDENADPQLEADLAGQRIQSLEKFVPTLEQINTLPEGIRRFIMLLETRCDPAGEVRSNVCLRDTVEALEQRNKELEKKIRNSEAAYSNNVDTLASKIEELEAERDILKECLKSCRDSRDVMADQLNEYVAENERLILVGVELKEEVYQLKTLLKTN